VQGVDRRGRAVGQHWYRARTRLGADHSGGDGHQPDTFCEYAQDADNSHTPATVPLVPMSTTAASITTPLPMGIGGSLDCGAGQPYTPSVNDIWVPGGTTPTSPSYYNVETTFQFVG
jgi:hypothetical protein